MSLDDQIRAASVPVYMTDPQSILEYYQEAYPGESQRGKNIIHEWKSEIVKDLVDLTGGKRASIARRFQGGRGQNFDRMTKSTREEYEQLGQALPPISYEAPPNGYIVTFVGEVRISKKCYPRHFTAHIIGADADEVAAGTADIVDIALYLYFEEDLAEGTCGEPSITVSAG